MMVSEVPLGRGEELMFVVACELRPALAIRDSSGPSVACGRVAVIAAARRHL
jgi:hypothetical protein